MSSEQPAVEAADGTKKEKKVRPGPPPPSASVTSAAAVIRGAMAAVIGQKLGGTCTAIQPILSEPGTAKVTMSIKNCEREEEIRASTPEGHAVILKEIEMAANDVLDANLAILQHNFTDVKQALDLFGDAITDEAATGKSAKKGKGNDDTSVDVICIPGVVAMSNPTHGLVCATTGGLGKITFSFGGNAKNSSVIEVGKKAMVNIKFTVTNADVEAQEPTDQFDALSEASKSIHGLNENNVTNEAAKISIAKAKEAAKIEEEKKNTSTSEGGGGGGGGAAEGEEEKDTEKDMVVDPWTVTGKIDYDKLIVQFGSVRIDDVLMKRIEALTVGTGRTKAVHRFLRRNIFFSHRDLIKICDLAEKRQAAVADGSPMPPPFYLYTGRGPSNSMHFGHLVPFMMTQWLQEAFDVPLVVQMTDDEKFLWKGEYSDKTGDNLMHFKNLTVENVKDIIACGFDKDKTFIFSDLDYMGHMYPNICRIWKAITYSQAKGCFGFEGGSNIGQSAFPAIQAAPSFPSTFSVPLDNDLLPCLIPCAIDQDPYFRITRDIAHKLVPSTHPLKGKPALIHAKFFPPLQGAEGKMSSSDDNSAIFLTDTPEAIEEKIRTHAFSGGQETKALQEKLGADLEKDVAYQWLTFFMEDDEELKAIGDSYSSGKGAYWSTGLVKAKLIEILKELVNAHQVKRNSITDEEVKEW
eukprot:CAMPEP_0114359162 /NCGR_PEP_ID=MMETSP0101-20121206/22809_1 /TAXON_ID=38822 ORGANISM="Pteridomonas danica, Strain PT" /NCGR_SAMPLE_ID=MMETSP0101 /ASSEMBLY_ACC=CAM_ASM_000211 /LENGTH=691 /DNA_ID=CAMNT_0001502565 /DNA_START=46 /DNA_END=2118 /DNA_ORIENTATION=+